MAPKDVNKNNENVAWLRQYSNQLFQAKEKTDINVGDRVRISTQKIGAFYKGFEPSWSDEIFQISDIRWTHPVTFFLTDTTKKREPIEGGFYRGELLKV
ncbi:unnamed protein product [Allacma fusca]|uniref:Uncharacterized protein n=1 Tax=Allacma fusca TaxID=39272 RepID=A0A8J2P8X2_9HEXA|nr:unnamed protein product [Allacma fusca]